MECMQQFCAAMQAEFGEYHLWQPSHVNYKKQLEINAARGFPSMFASLDCMHYKCKIFAVAWQGDYGDREGKGFIILEVVVDQGLHIWHIFFGLLGSTNDLNVLDRLPLIHNILTSKACGMTFKVNGQEYNRYYLLVDGMYSQWSAIKYRIFNIHSR